MVYYRTFFFCNLQLWETLEAHFLRRGAVGLWMYAHLYFLLQVIYIYMFHLLSRAPKMSHAIIIVSNDWKNFPPNIFLGKEEISSALFELSQKLPGSLSVLWHLHRLSLAESHTFCFFRTSCWKSLSWSYTGGVICPGRLIYTEMLASMSGLLWSPRIF